MLLAATACGPSLRRVQQSRVYFERCYAADFDARIPLAEKHACWSAWLEHYTHGQARDRVAYAQERVFAIEHGESVPRLPGLPTATVGPTSATPVTAVSQPLMADPTVPPAQAEDEELRRDRDRPRLRPMPRTANPACAARACEPAWRTCIDACQQHDAGCENACELELHACARGCF